MSIIYISRVGKSRCRKHCPEGALFVALISVGNDDKDKTTEFIGI